MKKRVAIVGGGASGLLCAIESAKRGAIVTLFEQNERCAKKILVSGNGRCNITNTDVSAKNFSSQNPEFTDYALRRFDTTAFERYMAEMGLLLHKNDDGRCYPLSFEAKSVALILESYARRLGVKFELNAKITEIKKLLHEFDAVVVATGSPAADHLGGNDDGAKFAKELGHTIHPYYPSLVQLHVEDAFVHKMAGAKVEAEVSLFVSNTKTLTKKGDLLFTNYGVSGLAILDLSQEASEALMAFERVSLGINLLPKFSHQQLSNYLNSFANSSDSPTLFELLCGILPLKISRHLLEYLHLEESLQASSLGVKNAKKIANAITNLRLEVTQTHGFRHAEVSGGGVCTSEIDAKSFESKKVKNLYFIGEVLDVVGERGGFNFAWCWASGFCAAQHITKIS